jgi:hypothetical protein
MLYPKATVYGLTVMKIICREALTLGVIDETAILENVSMQIL